MRRVWVFDPGGSEGRMPLLTRAVRPYLSAASLEALGLALAEVSRPYPPSPSPLLGKSPLPSRTTPARDGRISTNSLEALIGAGSRRDRTAYQLGRVTRSEGQRDRPLFHVPAKKRTAGRVTPSGRPLVPTAPSQSCRGDARGGPTPTLAGAARASNRLGGQGLELCSRPPPCTHARRFAALRPS